jgi:hypothetical protein
MFSPFLCVHAFNFLGLFSGKPLILPLFADEITYFLHMFYYSFSNMLV